MVEHSAVNRVVVGSSPTRGAKRGLAHYRLIKKFRLHGQAVKTSPFHGGNTGSIPVGVIYGLVAQLVRAPPCHGGGRGFESLLGRQNINLF